MTDLVLHARDVQHLLGNAGQAICVLLHHARQSEVSRVFQVLLQQGIGLNNGREGVANLVGDGCGHSAHGRQLFGAQPGFHFAQIMQKHHAQAFGARGRHRFLCGGEPGAHVQAHGALA